MRTTTRPPSKSAHRPPQTPTPKQPASPLQRAGLHTPPSKLAGLKAALGLTSKKQPAAATAPAGPAAIPVTKPKPKTEREVVIEQLDAAEQTADETDYELPPLELLLPNEDVCYEEQEKEVRRKAKILEKTFKDFGFNIRVVEIETGPVIAQYEIELEAGLRLSKITGLADDLAIALRVPSVRIVAPIPGKNTVGIEVPNENAPAGSPPRSDRGDERRSCKKMKIPLFLGKDVAGNPLVVDLRPLPHLLIAGRTGTGKSSASTRSSVDSDDASARRSPHAHDRPEDGRTQRVRATCRT